MLINETLPRAERVECWRFGVPISIAWFKFGSERLRAQQIERRGTPGASAIMSLMIADLFSLLEAGDLTALGYRTAPTLSDGPIQVPSDAFEVRPIDDDVIADTVVASGWRYERVVVLEPEQLASMLPQAQPPVSSATDPAATAPDLAEQAVGKKQPGPKGAGTELRRVYDQLTADGTVPPKHTLKAAYRAVVEYLERHPSSAIRNGRGLSYKSFARALASRPEE